MTEAPPESGPSFHWRILAVYFIPLILAMVAGELIKPNYTPVKITEGGVGGAIPPFVRKPATDSVVT